MKELTFEVIFLNLNINGDSFSNVEKTVTKFDFMLSGKPSDDSQVYVGVSAFTIWTFTSNSSAILQCTCGALPKAFLITEMSFDEYITVVEACIGQINLDLPSYLASTVLPNDLQIENLSLENYTAKLQILYDKLNNGEDGVPVTT